MDHKMYNSLLVKCFQKNMANLETEPEIMDWWLYYLFVIPFKKKKKKQ